MFVGFTSICNTRANSAASAATLKEPSIASSSTASITLGVSNDSVVITRDSYTVSFKTLVSNENKDSYTGNVREDKSWQ